MTRARVSMRVFAVLGVALAVGLAFAVSPFASSNPDGLERMAGDKGFLDEGRLHALQEDAPVPDYVFPGIGDGRLATGVAGFAGTLLVFGTAHGVGWALRRRSPGADGGGADASAGGSHSRLAPEPSAARAPAAGAG